jgi:hypothetical protein
LETEFLLNEAEITFLAAFGAIFFKKRTEFFLLPAEVLFLLYLWQFRNDLPKKERIFDNRKGNSISFVSLAVSPTASFKKKAFRLTRRKNLLPPYLSQ